MALKELATTPLVFVPLFCVTFGWLLSRLKCEWRRIQLQPPLPPGPPGWPIIGNTLDWPDIYDQEKTFAQWAEKYGPVVHVRVMGVPFVILNTSSAADDLLTKRSENYSDRHYTIMLHELNGAEELSLPFMTYTNRWRAYRKHFHSSFRAQDVKASHHIILDTSTEFLHQLANTPEDFRSHIRSYTSKIITKFVWGHEQSMATKDPLVALLDEHLDVLNEEMFNKLFLVDVLPFLKHVPASWPGAGFQRIGIANKSRQKKISDGLYNRLQSAIADGTATPCVVTRSTENALNRDGVLGEVEEKLIKENGTVSFGAGTDTSASVLANFFLAMTLHPEIQKQAQVEIDQITGRTRLPDLEDRKQLQLVDAIVLESLRWNAPLPIGIPHRAVNQDVYMGMRIPAGSVVIGNISSMLHSEEHFKNPDEFDPTRFFDQEGLLRDGLQKLVMDVFGFGRRICPGRHLAMDSTWTSVARILATFDIQKTLDVDGNEIGPDVRFTAGFTSHPVPFGCRITPRSRSAEY